MRVLIVTPRQSRVTGNRVTAERYRKGLEALGWSVRLVEAGENPAPLEEETVLFRPDVLLLLHAYRTGRLWLGAAGASRIPAVVVLTGTDIHGGIDSSEEGPVVREVLGRAASVITQNPLTIRALRHAAPAWSERLRYLPPGVELGADPYPLRTRHAISPEEVLFLHPAGIRPVKGNLELLRLFDLLAPRAPFRVVFCGPCLDRDYFARFLQAAAERPRVLYAGALPPGAMASVLQAADVVLNHSEKEGMPNALLEAAVLGRPILARDVPGNAAIVEEGVNGLLYRTAEEFIGHAGALLEQPELRRRLSLPRPDRYRPEEEARALDAILKGLP